MSSSSLIRIPPMVALATALAMSGLVTTPANAVTAISSSAYGLGVTLSVLNLIDASVGPLAPSGGIAPGPYSVSNSLATVSDSLNLGLGSQGLNTGLITSSASSPFPSKPTATATATVDNLSTGLAVILLPSILDISATTITSTSSVDGFNTLSALGSSTIEDLSISGSAIGADISLSGLVKPSPNDVIFNSGGLTITLNEQIPSGDGVTSAGIQTNAIDVMFNGFAYGTGLLTGDIIVSHSQADIVGPATGTVPEPASWSLMLLGFGGLGLALRSRRKRAASIA